MALSDLITTLRLEYHDRDENSPLLEDEQLERALRRGGRFDQQRPETNPSH